MGKEVFVVCIIECVVGIVCIVSVVFNGVVLVGEFFWILGLGIEGTLFGLVGFGKDGKDIGFLVRLFIVGGFCIEMNLTLLDGWLVIKVFGWFCRSWGWEDIVIGICKIIGKGCKEIVGWGFLLGIWVVVIIVVVLGVGRIDGVVREFEVIGVCNLGWLVIIVGGVIRLVEDIIERKKKL